MASKGRGYRTVTVDGFEVLIGRGARENDALTFGVAEPRDLWLHVAGGVPGSHVVVRNPEGFTELPRDVLRRAAQLAAYHSKARAAGGKVEVHVCRAADVSKPPRYPPGKVVLRRWDSLRVYPEAGGGGGSSGVEEPSYPEPRTLRVPADRVESEARLPAVLYEKLDAPMRTMVDAWAERLRGVPWARRSDLLAEAARPFGERFTGEQARAASRGFVTAVLERLGEDEVTDPYQASMYHLSLHPAHRAAALAYLEANPEVREIVEGSKDPPAEGDPPVEN